MFYHRLIFRLFSCFFRLNFIRFFIPILYLIIWHILIKPDTDPNEDDSCCTGHLPHYSELSVHRRRIRKSCPYIKRQYRLRRPKCLKRHFFAALRQSKENSLNFFISAQSHPKIDFFRGCSSKKPKFLLHLQSTILRIGLVIQHVGSLQKPLDSCRIGFPKTCTEVLTPRPLFMGVLDRTGVGVLFAVRCTLFPESRNLAAARERGSLPGLLCGGISPRLGARFSDSESPDTRSVSCLLSDARSSRNPGTSRRHGSGGRYRNFCGRVSPRLAARFSDTYTKNGICSVLSVISPFPEVCGLHGSGCRYWNSCPAASLPGPGLPVFSFHRLPADLVPPVVENGQAKRRTG